MTHIGVHEAKTNFSDLLRRVAEGEEIVITNSGRPTARLVPIPAETTQRIGTFSGQFEVPDDFDETPSELVEYFR
ncbi:MAG: type II toxin-antitoxin system Phd/YefM family antitoxin [Ilumatobacteraceae bacterium]